MKRVFFTFCLLLVALGSMAQVSFKVKPVGQVVEGENFTVTYRLSNAEGTNPKVVDIRGCELLFGPSIAKSFSYSVTNGKAVSRGFTDFTYSYKAGKAGSYTVPAASITVDGKTYRTEPLKFQIISRSDRDKPGSQKPVSLDDPDTQAAGRKVNESDVFVRIILSRNSAYEQEAIGCTIKLYTKYSISSFMPTKQPAFNGFLIQEQEVQPALNEVEVYNGQRYMTAILKKCILFPQKSGHLTINSGNYDLTVVQYQQINMGIGYINQPVEKSLKVSSNTGSIDIKPLPSGAPAGFDGAVGTFSAESRLVGNTFRTGDASSLIYTIRGTGNIKYLKEPVMDFPTEFELYTPKSTIKADVVGNEVTGSMEIEYTFVPQSVGDFTIGSHDFVYFDPEDLKYKTITTPSYNLHVTKGSNPVITQDQKDIETKNLDIQYIYLGEKNPAQSHTFVITVWWYWMLYLGGLLGLVLALYFVGSKAKRNANVVKLKQTKAGKEARQRLRAAKNALSAHNIEKFHEELLKATWGYLSDKLSIPLADLSRQNVAQEMEQKGYNQELISDFLRIIDEIEMARYTTTVIDPEKLFEMASEAINKTEAFKIPKLS